MNNIWCRASPITSNANANKCGSYNGCTENRYTLPLKLQVILAISHILRNEFNCVEKKVFYKIISH